MCIICCKRKGIAMPTEETIRQMWESNRDGAGLAWSDRGAVHIAKGFMRLDDLLEHLRCLSGCVDLTSAPMLMHFRIATHGGVTPHNTHPFPVTNKYKHMKRLTYTTDLAAVHNGIIPIKADCGVSDTMTYISKRLSRIKALHPHFYTNRRIMLQIEQEIQSKMALLTGEGEIYTVGNFIEEDGLLYSNSSYKRMSYVYDFDNYYDMKLLCPIYGYISSHGRLTDAEDELYMLDRCGNVYAFCEDFDAAERIDAYAYGYEGLPYRFDENEAFYMYVKGDGIDETDYKRNRR